jgi:hypothetical protein
MGRRFCHAVGMLCVMLQVLMFGRELDPNQLVPNEQVVEVLEFETEDPAMRGEMTITT